MKPPLIISIALTGLVIFLGLLMAVAHGPIAADEKLLDLMLNDREPGLTRATLFFSALGNFEVLAPVTLIIALIIFTLNKRLSAFFLVTMVGSTLLNQLMKFWIARPRPGEPWDLLGMTSFAFPSGHSMATASIALALCIVLGKLPQQKNHIVATVVFSALAVLYVLLNGLARVYLGAHYPSDVVAGWGLSLAWVSLCYLGICSRHSGG